jgi:uncharacterized protein YuzE
MASLEFDGDAGAIYLRFAKGKVASSEPLADNMILDIGKKGETLGLELLLPKGIKPELKERLQRAV